MKPRKSLVEDRLRIRAPKLHKLMNCLRPRIHTEKSTKKAADRVISGFWFLSGGSRTPVELFSAGVEAWGHTEIAVFTALFATNLSL